MVSTDALDASHPFDVCMVGSGPAGSILAIDLAQRWVRTLLLESGDMLRAWLMDRRLKELAAYEVGGSADYPTERTTSRLSGGNSKLARRLDNGLE